MTLLDAIGEFHPEGASERATRDAMVALARAGTAAQEHTVHFSVSCFVLHARFRQLLVHQPAGCRHWRPLGGHYLAGLDPRDCARRIARRLSGLEVEIAHGAPLALEVLSQDANDGTAAHAHLDLGFAALAPRDAKPRASWESTRLRWVALGQVGDLLQWGAAGQRLAARLATCHGRLRAGAAACSPEDA